MSLTAPPAHRQEEGRQAQHYLISLYIKLAHKSTQQHDDESLVQTVTHTHTHTQGPWPRNTSTSAVGNFMYQRCDTSLYLTHHIMMMHGLVCVQPKMNNAHLYRWWPWWATWGGLCGTMDWVEISVCIVTIGPLVCQAERCIEFENVAVHGELALDLLHHGVIWSEIKHYLTGSMVWLKKTSRTWRKQWGYSWKVCIWIIWGTAFLSINALFAPMRRS